MARRFHVRKRGTGWVYVIERGTYPAGHPREGKRWQEWSRQFATEEEAQLAGAKRLIEVGRSSGDPSKVTLSEWCDEVMEHWTHVEPPTMENYKRIIRLHIKPALGHIPLSDLTALHIQRWQTRLDLAGSTANLTRTVLNIVLEHAVTVKLLPDRPGKGVRAPAIQRQEQIVLDDRQVRAMLIGIEDRRERVAVQLLATTGMRGSDLRARQWTDFDAGRSALRISSHAQGHRTSSPIVPGRKRGDGTEIMLDRATSLLLTEWQNVLAERARTIPTWRDRGLIVPSFRFNSAGAMIGHNSLRRWVRVAGERIGVEGLTPHALRHSWATIALSNGVPLTVVSERLGHADTATTNRIYYHLLPKADSLARELMDELYGEDAG